MNRPKVFIIVLLITTILLLALLWVKGIQPTPSPILANVQASTLTQSLDGQRRYLSVDINNLGTFRVSAPLTTTCNKGDIALLQPSEALLSRTTSFRFISCQ